MKVSSVQDDQRNEYLFEEIGRYACIKGSRYVQFDEKIDGQSVLVTLKINPMDKEVILIRHTQKPTRFVFNNQEETKIHYYTMAGMTELTVHTKRITLTHTDYPTSGNVMIDYQLWMGEQLIGDYAIQLHFTT